MLNRLILEQQLYSVSLSSTRIHTSDGLRNAHRLTTVSDDRVMLFSGPRAVVHPVMYMRYRHEI